MRLLLMMMMMVSDDSGPDRGDDDDQHVHDLLTIMIITTMVLVVRLPLTVVRAIQLELNLLAAAMLVLVPVLPPFFCDDDADLILIQTFFDTTLYLLRATYTVIRR